MKRSEFIRKLQSEINWYSDDIDMYVDDIMDLIEDSGMRPPCSCHDDIEHTKEKGYGPRCGISWHLSEWEEE